MYDYMHTKVIREYDVLQILERQTSLSDEDYYALKDAVMELKPAIDLDKLEKELYRSSDKALIDLMPMFPPHLSVDKVMVLIHRHIKMRGKY